jgi:hypothetical protein
LIYSVKPLIIKTVITGFISAGLAFIGPLCINKIVNYLLNPFADESEGYYWAALLLCSYFLKTFF